MDSLVFLLLFFSSFPGTAAVKTLAWLNAQRGGSVTIPCFYHQEYRGSVKYWCKGSKQTPMVRTDSSQRNDQVSISDDPAHLVFYVTMRNLEQEDTDIYWCAIKTNKEKDVFAVLDLKVLAGGQRVWTESWMSAEGGGSVTVPCYYDQRYKHHVKYWCKGFIWELCSILVRTDSAPNKGDMSITDDPDRLVFTVTMRNLQEKDTDWYWCAVEIGDTADYGAFLPVIVREEIDFTSVVQHSEDGPSRSNHPPTEAMNTTDGSSKPADLPKGRTLDVLRHSVLALVYLICTIIAMIKTWIYCRKHPVVTNNTVKPSAF